jgi:hypothetical protein
MFALLVTVLLLWLGIGLAVSVLVGSCMDEDRMPAIRRGG